MNAPCAAADHCFIRVDGPVLFYLLKNSWTMDRTFGLRSSLPQAPCSSARLPMSRRCFTTRPMECGSSSCKTPCGVPKTTSSSSGYPDLPDDFHLGQSRASCTAASISLPPLLNIPFSTPLSQCCDVVYAKFLEACSRQRARAADILEKGIISWWPVCQLISSASQKPCTVSLIFSLSPLSSLLSVSPRQSVCTPECTSWKIRISALAGCPPGSPR